MSWRDPRKVPPAMQEWGKEYYHGLIELIVTLDLVAGHRGRLAGSSYSNEERIWDKYLARSIAHRMRRNATYWEADLSGKTYADCKAKVEVDIQDLKDSSEKSSLRQQAAVWDWRRWKLTWDSDRAALHEKYVREVAFPTFLHSRLEREAADVRGVWKARGPKKAVGVNPFASLE